MNDNKTFINKYFEALNNQPKTTETIAKYVADESLTRHILDSEAAFPRYKVVVSDVIAEGDKVAVRGTLRGEHLGSFAGIPPTGRTVEAELIIIYQIHDGKIVNHWMQFDAMALMQQIQHEVAAAT